MRSSVLVRLHLSPQLVERACRRAADDSAIARGSASVEYTTRHVSSPRSMHVDRAAMVAEQRGGDPVLEAALDVGR